MRAGEKALKAGNCEVAEQSFLAALELAEQSQCERTCFEATLSRLSELASTYFRQQRAFEKSATLCHVVIEAGRRRLDWHHPALVSTANTLAELYYDRHRADRELPTAAHLRSLSDLALGISENVEKSSAPALADSLYCLATIYYHQEEFAAAERLVARALALRLKSPPRNRSDLVHDYYLLVNCYCWQSKFEQAELSARDWLQLAEEELPPDDLYLSEILLAMAELYCAQGRFLDAEPFYRRALALHESRSCLICPAVSRIMRSYAHLLRLLKRSDEAAQMELRAHTIEEELT